MGYSGTRVSLLSTCIQPETYMILGIRRVEPNARPSSARDVREAEFGHNLVDGITFNARISYTRPAYLHEIVPSHPGLTLRFIVGQREQALCEILGLFRGVLSQITEEAGLCGLVNFRLLLLLFVATEDATFTAVLVPKGKQRCMVCTPLELALLGI